jgi:hypothetical protein
MNKKSNIIVLSFLAFAFVSTSSAEAHRDGCHAAHSCPSDTGSYVCGDLGNSSECGDTPKTDAAPAPTSAPIKQYVAPIATKAPLRQPTSTPTVQPTVEPTKRPTATPVQKTQVVPTAVVAGESSSSNPVGALITLGILGGLGYLGHKKFKIQAKT